MRAIDERREELMRIHLSDLRAIARLKHVNLGDASTKRAAGRACMRGRASTVSTATNWTAR